LQNETRVQQTTDDFCRFLNNVEKISEPGSVTLLGHSMGATFVDQAMVRRAIKNECAPLKPFREIIMSNADVDARTFLKHDAEFAGNASKVRIYFSTDDDRLSTSATAHGGFPRLGAPGDLLDELARAKNMMLYDITKLDTGHEIPFSAVAAIRENGDAPDGFTLERREPGYFRVSATVSKP
jgi:esterase/lipase superfamily enzyme